MNRSHCKAIPVNSKPAGRESLHSQLVVLSTTVSDRESKSPVVLGSILLALTRSVLLVLCTGVIM